MTGVSIGFFTPAMLVRDVDAFCTRVRQLVSPSSRAFPFSVEPLVDETGKSPMSYAVLSGFVPIHIDQPNETELCTSVFQFVMAVENRPCLISTPASRQAALAVFDQDERATFGMGALELRAGRAIHFDITTHFHAITGLPTGDPVPEEPSAVILQVPYMPAGNIQAALAVALAALRRDERVSDLVR